VLRGIAATLRTGAPVDQQGTAPGSLSWHIANPLARRMQIDPLADVARAAAVQLGADAAPELATAVERALVARDVSQTKDQ
jgi:hypothetical protein